MQRKYIPIGIVLLTFIVLFFVAVSTFTTSVVTDPINTEVEVLSWEPRAFLYRKFLSHQECEQLIQAGKDKLQRSQVVGDEKDAISNDRTSYGAWIDRVDSKFVDERIAAVTHLPVDHGEDLYLLNYQKTQQYKPHFDWFGETEESQQEAKLNGERIATMIIYLSQVETGGETWFPRANLKVKPAKGDALLFYDVLPDNKVDAMSEHAGRPVIDGTKWIATRWIRERQYYFPEEATTLEP
jgi:prolyl 4-hydroxylase